MVQFVFHQLFLSLPNLLTERPIKAWLYTVARNRSLDYLRKKRSRVMVVSFSEWEQDALEEKFSLLEGIVDPYPLPEEFVEQEGLCDPLQQAMFTLSPEHCVIVLLRSVEQWSFAEIAGKLKRPTNSVKTCYYRSLLKLRAMLEHDQAFLA